MAERLFIIFESTDSLPSKISISYISYWNCKKQFDSLHKKENSVLIAVHYFFRQNGNFENEAKSWSF